MSSVDHSKLKPELLSSQIDVTSFDCGDDDLNDFIKNDALKYQDQKIAQTTCIMYDGRLIGYYTLVCDTLALFRNEKRRLLPFKKRIFKSYPAIKLARMALIKEHQGMGVGSVFIKVIKGLATDLNNSMGIACRFITVDAYEGKVGFYKRNGFEENFVEGEKRDGDTISMRFDLK